MPTTLAEGDIARVLAIAAPAARITSWRITPDAYPVLTPSTESLDRVVATRADGADVRVFVKTIRSLRHWPLITMVPEAFRDAAIARFPWRTEADVYGSSLVGSLPDGLRAPQIYAIDDLGDDRMRIWMEDLPPTPARWDRPRYGSAARRLGRLAGRTYRDGLPAGTPALFGGLRLVWALRIAPGQVVALRDEATWRHPLMAAVEAADPDLRSDLLAVADVAPAILDALDALPRGLAHGDACPQNLLPDPDRADGLVAIDWGFANIAPLGADLVQLLTGRADNGELEASELPALQEAILSEYLAGMADEGIATDARDVRYAFLAGLVVGKSFSALPLERLGGQADEAAAAAFLARATYARYLVSLRSELAGG